MEDFLLSNVCLSNFYFDVSVDKNNLKRLFCMKMDIFVDILRIFWLKGRFD